MTCSLNYPGSSLGMWKVQCVFTATWDFGNIVWICFSPGALPSLADLTDVGEHKKHHLRTNVCACVDAWLSSPKPVCQPIDVKAVCVCAHVCVCLSCACLKINSRVCPLVIAASHVDKSEPHCAQSLVLKSIMDLNHRDFSDCVHVCVCVHSYVWMHKLQIFTLPGSLRGKCIMDDIMLTWIGFWILGKAFRSICLFKVYRRWMGGWRGVRMDEWKIDTMNVWITEWLDG